MTLRSFLSGCAIAVLTWGIIALLFIIGKQG